jgi:putative DNA primase/helicase
MKSAADAYTSRLEDAAERDLAATLQNAARIPAKKRRDNRDNRDTASRMGSTVPDDSSPIRDSRDGDDDASAFWPHFELLECPDDGRSPGVYWIGVRIDRDTGRATGEEAPVWVCSPMKVAAMTRDAQGGAWGRLLEFPDADGRVHRWCMPMSMLAGSGDELRASLLREGLMITSHPGHRRYVGDYIQRAQPDVFARCVERTGWHGGVFVLPRETFGDTAAEPVLFQSANPEGAAIGCGGTLDGWRNEAAARCAGNSRLVLAVSTAFAGPCLDLIGMEGGGFHLRGSSSTGKSTAANIAASVYGEPKRYAKNWRQTDNALEGTALLHSDMLLILDEIGQLDPRHAGQVAYMLANGQGKGRSNRDGSARAVATWRLLFLSNGEIALADLVTQAGGTIRAGQEARVIDLPADAGAGFGVFESIPPGMGAAAFAESLGTAAATHFGHALPAFLRAILSAPDAARAALRGIRDALVAELAGSDASGQVRRVAQRFALVAAAGELATAFGLTGWPEGEAADAARACFSAWLASRGTAGNAEPAAMLSQVRAFMERHGESRFTAWEATADGPRTINRAGYRKAGNNGPTYYVTGEVFRREVCNGFDPKEVARVLIAAGALIAGSGGESTRKERLPDGTGARVYVIGPGLWSAE